MLNKSNSINGESRVEERLVPDIDYAIFRRCTPSWRMYQHRLDFCDITYITEGKAQYIINGNSYNLQDGDLLCLPKGCIRSGITYPDHLMCCFSVNFRLNNYNGETMSLPFPIVSHVGCQNDIISMFHTLVNTWIEKQPGYIIKTQGLFLLILHRLFELIVFDSTLEEGDYRVKKAIRYITRHYSERLSVKNIANMVGLNAVYFGALFKQSTGLSINRYVIQTRIKNAENFLISGEYRVEEVAAHCGFSDVAHFYKLFKELMGFPPSYYIPKHDKVIE
ncbi:MAG: AraC family transcriptional regulator [Treponema sp.]|jgi:AraC-like DNA-binding protein|nr:AraC family transcriptional regulator [Treponema sp.]